jgi:hypothetical protein
LLGVLVVMGRVKMLGFRLPEDPPSLNFSQFVEEQSWWTWERVGIEDARLFPRDGLCHGEAMVGFSASIDGLQRVKN